MQIKLTESELENAVRSYIRDSGITGLIGEIDFTATRGNEGIITNVQIGELPSGTSLGNRPETPSAAIALEDAESKPAKEADATNVANIGTAKSAELIEPEPKVDEKKSNESLFS